MTLNNLRGWAWVSGPWSFTNPLLSTLYNVHKHFVKVQGWFYSIAWTVELLSTRINVPKQDEVTLKGYICTFVYCICTHTHMYENIYLSKFTFGPSSPCILCAYQIYDRVSLKGGLEGGVREPTNVSCVQRS